MNCPECERKLDLTVGISKATYDVKPGEKREPPLIYQNYICVNKRCSKYRKKLTYNIELGEWVINP